MRNLTTQTIVSSLIACSFCVHCPANEYHAATGQAPFSSGMFRWRTGVPILLPVDLTGDTIYSVKDPSIVRYEGKWHLFTTIRGNNRSHAVLYVAFDDFKNANNAQRHVLKLHPGFYCAPQVFYFTPQKKWYMICQAADEAWGEPPYRPAFSTSDNIADPDAWSPLKPMFEKKPASTNSWLDFWVICDDENAFFFFTSLNGKMWRSQTTLSEFPLSWSEPVVAIQGDVFEASHTYCLKGMNKYLTLIEAQNGHGWRYYKAYLAENLNGQWTPLAAEKEKAFASMKNVRQTAEHWTDSISHGELIRDGIDQKLEVDPANLRFLFQGVTEAKHSGKNYGQIPWSLGILEPEN